MNITVYGDSILKGVLLEEGKYKMNRSWEQRLAAEHGLTIRNKAHFGSTIGKALGLIEKDCAETWTEGELALLEFGGNDCDFDWAAIAENPEGSYVINSNRPYMEFSVGIHNIFKIIHVEYVRRLNYNELPTAHKHGIRLKVRATF